MSENEKEMHVDKLTIHADNIYLEGSERRRDPFLFGRRRREDELGNENDEEYSEQRRRLNPFLNERVYRPTEESTNIEEKTADAEEQTEQVEGNEEAKVEKENEQAEHVATRRRPFWLS